MSDYKEIKRLLRELREMCEYLDEFANELKTNTSESDGKETDFTDGIVFGLDYARKKFDILIKRETLEINNKEREEMKTITINNTYGG